MVRCHCPRILASVVAVAFLLLAAGCGGGGSPSVASVASSTTTITTATQNGALAYSRCMRSHGVANFPDPDSHGNVPSLQPLGVSKQTWAPADIACKHLLPNGGNAPQETPQQIATRVADGVSFANCMRSHRVTRFPDPNAHGDLGSVAKLQAQGIDAHAPAFLQAVQACLPASHGALTPATVRAALQHAGG